MKDFEIKMKFRDYMHYVTFMTCADFGRTMLNIDKDFKIRKRKKKLTPKQ